MPAATKTIKQWAGRLSIEDEQLTLEEARTLATIAQADRLLEIRDTLSDVQMRLMRAEQFLSIICPQYDEWVRERLKRALSEAS